jgi:hypothetical protein
VGTAMPGAEPRTKWSDATGEAVIPRVMNGVSVRDPHLPLSTSPCHLHDATDQDPKELTRAWSLQGADMPAGKLEMERSGRSRPSWFKVPAPPPENKESKYANLKKGLR